MRKLQHPNIVRQENSFHTSEFIVIVMEYCESGNLLSYQAKLPGRIFPLPQALQVLCHVLHGLKAIHQNNYVHRDIKSENVLLKKVSDGHGGFDFSYKIADFGFARSIGWAGAKTHCGTEKYMAPEILSNAYYGIAVDIWALGVLFYFMLFAEYPFRGHDLKSEIQRRCSPVFNLQGCLSKKDRMKEVTPELEDFFRKIFVIDPRKRINFSGIVQHSLLAAYRTEFNENIQFYDTLEAKEEFKDEIEPDENTFNNEMQPEDPSRAALLKKQVLPPAEQHIERELDEIAFEADRVLYLKECASEMFDNYTSYLSYPERLAARYYLLKAFLFFAEPLARELQAGRIPDPLQEADVAQKWVECTQSAIFKKIVSNLQEECLKAHFLFEDTYSLLQDQLATMPIKNFEKGYTQTVKEKKFDELKFAYRTTTSHLFKAIHENKKIEPHLRNKIKLRIFCCHMINRIFGRKESKEHFPLFWKWFASAKPGATIFDFTYFKRWILQESQENLEKNITLLHKAFF